MNPFCRTVISILILLSTPFFTNAQDKSSISDLIKQGVQLNDEGNYTGAIDKYNEALKIDPENTQANYELAFSLFASGKGNDGIPYVEKTIKGSTSVSLTAAAYDLLGSIYDQHKQSAKAIEAYKKGIEVNPKYQRLRYNLGIAYFRNKQYAEAEASAIEAIKLDPKHAGSLRMYALVTFHQNKRLNALLGFCSYLLLDPQSAQSAEAFGNIQHILLGGILKDGNGRNTIILSSKGNQENEALNLVISMSVLSGQTKKLKGMALLEYELKAIFTIAGESSEKNTEKTFFDNFFVDYFYRLAKTDNMPAFTHLISLSVNKEENTKWMGENDVQVKALDNWVATTPRGF